MLNIKTEMRGDNVVGCLCSCLPPQITGCSFLVDTFGLCGISLSSAVEARRRDAVDGFMIFHHNVM